jgi:hypothetical protein
MSPVFSEVILGKYTVTYFYCEKSGLLQSEKPYWLDEAYQEAIADTDTGLVQRNLSNSRFLEVLIPLMFNSEGKFLDVSGGYGLLTRLMRDKGFDFYSTDKYCKNLFASSFEPEANFKADALFAFEVLEHIEDPLSFSTDIFSQYGCKTIVFSTLTFSNDQIPSQDWWYYAFETGQHITFYQPRTLALIAKKLGCNYYMISPEMHIFTDKVLSKVSLSILFNKYLNRIYVSYLKRKRKGRSKTWNDYLIAKEKLKQSQIKEYV